MVDDMTAQHRLRRDPYPGVPMLPPEQLPGDCQQTELIGYRLVTPPPGMFCQPDPSRLSWRGWLSCTILALLFWPASCVPCCLTCAYDTYQQPVYA